VRDSSRIVCLCLCALMLLFAGLPKEADAADADGKIRVLYVGGDWKAQLPNFNGDTPMRGFFVKQEVEKAAPGRFDFTLWTSYEYLQYAEVESLRQWDVIVIGDIMGLSFLPRAARAMREFVEGGGGFWYCDNHKAFNFYMKERSFDDVLPIEVKAWRPYSPGESQPSIEGGKPLIAAPEHPVVKGLDWQNVPELRGAKYGELKDGAVVLATMHDKPIWVAWDKGRGRALWTGGVFANDELSTDFAKWQEIGNFYVQTLSWLTEKSEYPAVELRNATASGTLTVNLSKRGPEVTSKHFGIHGAEIGGKGERSVNAVTMQGEDLRLYQELNLDGAFARTSGFQAIKNVPGGGRFEFLDDGTDITTFDWDKYDFTFADAVLKDLERIKAEPIFMYWQPWGRNVELDKKQSTKWFAASIQHVNGDPDTPEYKPRLKYFEILNEPHLHSADKAVPTLADYFSYASSTLRKRYPGVKFGMGPMFEWTYVQDLMTLIGENLDWHSRHPYGQTGEGVFALQDKYLEHAKAIGNENLEFLITEWDFWIYGEPAFDYIMMRWKPLVDRADVCKATMHFRWREYQEGGYVFGVNGQFSKSYGQLPPEWPNPGINKPITYRYNAFWAMRDCRGGQYAVDLDIPQLPYAAVADDPVEYAERVEKEVEHSTRAYAVATSNGEQFNIVIYYGYPYINMKDGVKYDKLELRVVADIPPEVKGRQLVIERADCRNIVSEPAQVINGDRIDMTVTLDSTSAVSLTVK